MKNRIVIHDPKEIAEKLLAIHGEIANFEVPLKELKAHRDELRELMFHALQDNRMNSLELEGGVSFTRAVRTSLAVSDEKKAIKWAQENDSLKIDTVKANKILKGAGAVPEGFEYKETPYLATAGLNSKEEV